MEYKMTHLIYPTTNFKAIEQISIERGDGCYVWDTEGNQYLEDVQGEFIYDFVEESEIYLQFIDYTSDGKEVIILLNKYTLDLTSYVDKVEYFNGKCEIIEKQL